MIQLKRILNEFESGQSLGQLETFFIGSKNFNVGYDVGLIGKNKQLTRDIAVHNSDYGAGDAAHQSRGGHKGIDVFAKRGEPVVAPVTGIILKVTTQDLGTGGKTVTIQKNNINYYHAHLDRVFVKAGQTIKAGQLIGTVGDTGNARGTHPHVHFSMYRAKDGYDKGSIDPWPFIKDAAYIITQSDNDLKTIQRKLKKAGFDLGDEIEQGINGPLTQNALEKLRQRYKQEKDDLPINILNFIKNILGTAVQNNVILPKQQSNSRRSGKTNKQSSFSSFNAVSAPKIVMTFLKNKGFSTSQAAGIAGNMQIESGFDPKAVGDSGTSFGIVQWHGVNGDNLKKWCEKNGYAWDSMNGQLEFLWWELKNHQATTMSALKTQSNPRDAAYVFAKMFERPAHIGNNRADAAEEIYNNFTKSIIKKIA